MYKKGLANNIIIQFVLKSSISKKRLNCNLEEDPDLRDLLEYINFSNFKERLVYKKPQEGLDNKFSLKIENLLEILDFVLS